MKNDTNMKNCEGEVELMIAHEWICDSCGRNNFVSAVTFEGSEKDKADLREEMGLDQNGGEDGQIVTAPDEVRCKHCGSWFKVNHAEVL